jgi:hypothetical protein
MNLPATTHDFSASLAYSRQFEDAQWWADVYKKAFPSIDSMVSVREDGWAQRAGIDRILVLRSGKVIKIDEKVRSRDYPDFCLERWSDERRQIPGWIQKPLDCDFIAYAFVQCGLCYLLPTLLLQHAWRNFGRKWIAEYQEIRAQNNGYVTVSIAVPREIVLDAIREVIVVPFEAAAE